MRILAVDDDAALLAALASMLGREHRVEVCPGGEEALAALGERAFDLVLTDLRMPGADGMAVLRAARALTPAPPVVVLTGVDTARSAIEALRDGAADYLVKPVEPATLLACLARLAGGRGDAADDGLAGTSAAITRVRRLIPLLARSRESVLILGETGVGKEVLARALHRHGPASAGPFVAHNMAATPAELTESLFFGHVRGAFSGAVSDRAGLFEQADRGTLFLDEVDSFALALQPKLLRALETGHVQRVGCATERPVAVPVIAASATCIHSMVERGEFRADLYYRLRQLEVVMPPLRERREDIPCLVRQFLAELAEERGEAVGIDPAAEALLVSAPWRGNCRELRNAIRSAACLAESGTIGPGHLPPELVASGSQASGSPADLSLREVEERHIRRALGEAGGKRGLAAKLLGIDRGTLARKLRGMKPRTGGS